MKNKILTNVVIVCLIVAALMSLTALAGLLFQFGGALFSGRYWHVVLTLIILMVASIFVRNALDVLDVVKSIPVLCTIPLVVISALLGIICIWGYKSGTIVNVTISVAIVATIMLIISTQKTKLGNQRFGMQLAGYLFFCLAAFITLGLIWSIIKAGVLIIFLMAVGYVVGGVLVIILGVLSNKIEVATVNEQYIKIKKSEYEALLREREELRGNK